jgi:uncharacterized protein YcfL
MKKLMILLAAALLLSGCMSTRDWIRIKYYETVVDDSLKGME